MKLKTKAVLGAIGAAAAVDFVRAAAYTPEKQERIKLPAENVDADRAAEHISKAIQFKTVSYPDPDDMDWQEFERFHAFLDEAYPLTAKHLEKEIVDRASLLYRWKGTDPSLEPIALLAHQDVVPISKGTEQDWEHEPFSGDIADGFIWGRGAMDMKNHLICVMEAVETLLEDGYQPTRDVYLCFGHNEEIVASDHSGACAIAELFKSRGIHLDCVIDEGGAILPLNIKGVINGFIAGIGIAEKGYADFEITVETKGGHSSQPPKHSGLGQLANVIRDLENNQFKAEMLPFLTELFDKIGRRVSLPAKMITCNLPYLNPLIKEILKLIPPGASLIRTTTGVTMAQGSPAANVLPQRSSIVVNFRAMPGTTTKDIEEHIHKVVKNKKIKVECLKAKEASNFSPTDSRAFKALEKITVSDYPEAIVAPYLVMGGTDAYYYERVCENVYRYSPFIADTKLLLCTHGTNERLPLATVGEAVVFFKRYIKELSGC
ncbi:MAG: M20/M25/M40 family metallo-hydrolase [Clostridia bacterium]|nr:M20/M25/M40 family metallo-hydrolase [Clostridia bacterium]